MSPPFDRVPSIRSYAYGRTNEPERAPDYDRVVRSLTTRELRDERDGGRGTPEYQQAVQGELERREAV